MNRFFFLLGLLMAFNSVAQQPISTSELQLAGTTAFSTTNGRIRYNSTCNCFVFRYGGANVTPPLVAAPGAGQSGQSVRWNNGSSSWEYFTPSSGTVNSVSGTTNRITIGGTAADPTIDIASNYIGQNTITTLGTITTGVWTGTDIAYANITQGSGLSVLGVTGSSTADNASITGTANQILRINGAGTSNAFGSIDLSQSAAVGSSILGIANGGTGSSTALWWPLTGTGTFTGNVTIAQGSNTFTNTYTSNVGTTVPYTVSPSITATANNQAMVALDLNTTFANGGFTGTSSTALKVRTGRVGMGLGATNPSAALHIKSEGTTSSSSALIIQDSGNNNMFRLLDDGFIRLGSNGSPPNIGPTTSGTALAKSGEGVMITTNLVGTTVECTASDLSGSKWKFRVHGTNSPSSASTATFRDVFVTSTYDFTSAGAGATAIGFDWNPTVTSVTNLYGILIQPTGSRSGFATATPTSTVHVNGSLATGINTTAITINTTLNTTQEHWIFDTTGGNITASLPDATTCIGRIYVITTISASNTLSIDPNGSQTINGSSANHDITGTAYSNLVIQSAGSLGWIIRATN